jgi:hypothetical protein
MTGGVTQTGPSTFVKTSGFDNVFDGQVYSQQGYARGVYVTASASQADSDVIFGLNSDPAADAGFASTDYAWYLLGDGPGTDYQCEIRESGVYVSAHGSHIGSTFTITYDGANIRYFKDGSLIRTVARAIGSALYLDSSFSNVGGGLTSLNFGPMGEVGGATTITATNDTTTTTLYPVMVGAAGSSEVPKVTTTKLSFNAATGYAYSNSFNCGDWFRSTGDTGWFSSTHGGGIYMNNSSQVKVYNNKTFWAGAFGASTAGSNDSSGQIMIENGGGTGEAAAAVLAFHCSGQYGAKLHLRPDGYMGMGGWSASSWRWYVYLATGDMTAAGNITAYSDIRLKENITPLENSLYKIKKLNGVRFTWKDLPDIVGSPGKADFGILAHEVAYVAPELISDSVHISPDGDPYKTVAYDKLVPLLIEAIKEMSNKIDDLQEQIEELRNK